MSFKHLAPLLAILLLAASTCQAGLKTPPESDGTIRVYMAKGFPDNALEATDIAMPGSWYGISSYKPGSKALEALLRSLGLTPKGDKMAMQAKGSDAAPKIFETDLGAYLPSINPTFRTGEPPAGKYFTLMPAASYRFKSDTDFAVDCEFRIELFEGGKSAWQARYVYNRDETFSTTDSGVAAKLEDNYRDCFQLLAGMFSLHRAKGAALFKEAELGKEGKTSIRPVVWAYFPARVIYLDEDGMVDEDNSHFEVARFK